MSSLSKFLQHNLPVRRSWQLESFQHLSECLKNGFIPERILGTIDGVSGGFCDRDPSGQALIESC